MIQVGDIILASPESITEKKGSQNCGGKAEVVYIHPEGRFYTLRFRYNSGSFTESRAFTPQELEAGIRCGMFTSKSSEVIMEPSRQPRRKNGTPQGYVALSARKPSNKFSDAMDIDDLATMYMG